MGFVTCSRCGKEWDTLYVDQEMSESERAQFRKGLGCPKCQSSILISPENERKLSRKAVHESLDEVSEHFFALTQRCTQRKGGRDELTPGTELYTLLEDFFLSCQKVEERIKNAMKKDFIGKEEVETINKTLQADVTTVLQLAQKTSFLSSIIIELAETKPVIMEVLQSFASPTLYRDFQGYTRTRDPIDPVPLHRMTVRKGI
jgi:DNA-directed RNA polymerase subunit RPC12/RpoP